MLRASGQNRRGNFTSGRASRDFSKVVGLVRRHTDSGVASPVSGSCLKVNLTLPP